MPQVLTTSRYELSKPRRFQAMITVDAATEIIERWNLNNRKIRRGWVRELARRIKTGLWKRDHGNSLVFSASGELLDGQHRVLAVIESKIAVEMAVVTGADPDVRMFTDDGKARRAWDRITFVENDHIANEWAAKMTTLLAFAGGSTRRQCASDYLFELFNENAAGITWVAQRPYNCKGFSVAVHLAVALYYNAFPEQAEKMWAALRDPQTNVTQARLLREMAIGGTCHSSMERLRLLRRTLAGLRAHLEDRDLVRIMELNGSVMQAFDRARNGRENAEAQRA